MSKMIHDLQQLRADLDVLLTLASVRKDSRELSSAYTKMQECKLHVGNAIYALVPVSPYPNSTDPSNATIDPYHVDGSITPIATPADWNSGTIVENVKILRRELDTILHRIQAVSFDSMSKRSKPGGWFAELYLATAIVRCIESFNYYGLELGRIRETTIGN